MESNDTIAISTDLVRAMYDLIDAHEEQYELAEQLVDYWSDGYASYYSEQELVRRYGEDHGHASLEDMEKLNKQHSEVLDTIERLTKIVRTNELLHLVRPKVVVPYPDATPTAG